MTHLAGPGAAPQNGSIWLNATAPDFTATTTLGPMVFSQWARGSWVVFFSHPADFTPVCTSEFLAFAQRYEDFEKRGVKLLGCSIDSVYSHIAWTRNIAERFGQTIPFPVIADVDQNVARLYNMLHEPASITATVRSVFFIDPNFKIRAMIHYPFNLGRSFAELLRVVDGLQHIDETGHALPADWNRGDPVIMPPPTTVQLANERAADRSLDVVDWYFARRRL